MCDDNLLGTEIHVMVHCKNAEIVKLRKHLFHNMVQCIPEAGKLPYNCLIKLLLLAINPTASFYFAVFLKKLFHIVNISSPES